MDRSPELVDRRREWDECVRMWEGVGPDLYFVRGRRRAGKSFLLTRFAEAVGGVYYQATKKTDREQLATLSRIVGRRFNDPLLERVTFETWEDFFSYCVARAAGERFLLVLDEFPYLTESAPALASIIQSIWDHDLRGTRFKLVLSGSHITAMKRLTEADQPLYGRRTGLIQVDPFDYEHVGDCVARYSPADRIRVYAMFGGLPGNLSLVDDRLPLAENVARLLLKPSGRLHEEAPHVFDAFIADAAVPNSIVEAIAHGETRWNKISNRIGKTASSLSRPLEWLREMEVIEHVAPITGYPKPSPKSMVYRLRDPYLQFWHTFIADLRARGYPDTLSPEEMWATFIGPRFDEYVGRHVFERVCRQFVANGTHSALPFRPVRVGSWWADDASDELDVVALGANGEVLFGECKWGRVGRDDIALLEARADQVTPLLPGVREVKLALFSGGGVADAATRRRVAAGEVVHFGLKDLFSR